MSASGGDSNVGLKFKNRPLTFNGGGAIRRSN